MRLIGGSPSGSRLLAPYGSWPLQSDVGDRDGGVDQVGDAGVRLIEHDGGDASRHPDVGDGGQRERTLAGRGFETLATGQAELLELGRVDSQGRRLGRAWPVTGCAGRVCPGRTSPGGDESYGRRSRRMVSGSGIGSATPVSVPSISMPSAPAARTEAGETPAYIGATDRDLGPHAVERSHTEIDTERGGDLGGEHPVGAGGPGRGDLLGQQADPAFEVGERAVDLTGVRRRPGRCRPRRRTR